MSRPSSAPPSRPARVRAKPTPRRLATLAPSNSACRGSTVLVFAFGQLRGARAVRAEMIGQTLTRKASAATSQPVTTATAQGTSDRSAAATIAADADDDGSAHSWGVPSQPSVVAGRWWNNGHGLSVADRIGLCHDCWSPGHSLHTRCSRCPHRLIAVPCARGGRGTG